MDFMKKFRHAPKYCKHARIKNQGSSRCYIYTFCNILIHSHIQTIAMPQENGGTVAALP